MVQRRARAAGNCNLPRAHRRLAGAKGWNGGKAGSSPPLVARRLLPWRFRFLRRRLRLLLLRLPLDALRQLFPARLTIPFLERLGRNLPFDEELCEFPALGLALERHQGTFFSAAASSITSFAALKASSAAGTPQ